MSKNHNQPPPRSSLGEENSRVDATPAMAEIDDKDPNFHYQWASADPTHPQYVGRLLRPRKADTQDPEAPVLAPYMLVNDDFDAQIRQGTERQDAGSMTGSAFRNGSMYLVKTPIAEREKALAYQRKRANERREMNSRSHADAGNGVQVRETLHRGKGAATPVQQVFGGNS